MIHTGDKWPFSITRQFTQECKIAHHLCDSNYVKKACSDPRKMCLCSLLVKLSLKCINGLTSLKKFNRFDNFHHERYRKRFISPFAIRRLPTYWIYLESSVWLMGWVFPVPTHTQHVFKQASHQVKNHLKGRTHVNNYFNCCEMDARKRFEAVPLDWFTDFVGVCFLVRSNLGVWNKVIIFRHLFSEMPQSHFVETTDEAQ